MSKVIRFESRRAGTIEVPAEDVVHFEPLPGFPKMSRFVLMEHDAGSELGWMVSLDDADLAFVVASPWQFFPQYDPPIEREHLAALGIERRDDVEMLCMVTLSGKQIHLNLAAPLLVNAVNRKGMQVVSDDPRYTTRAAIPMLTDEPVAQRVDAAPDSGSSPNAPSA